MEAPVNIEETPLFQNTNRSLNGSLKVLRTFLFLDQCHDFLEGQDRNKWWRDGERGRGSQLDQAYSILVQNLFTDIVYINENWSDNNPEIDLIIYRYAEIWKANRKKAGVSSQMSILKNYVLPLQTEIRIKDIDLAQIMGTQFSKEDQARNIISIMDPQSSGSYLLIGVDADNSYDHFSPFVNHIENTIIGLGSITENMNGIITLFNSPATEYDAASGSSLINNLKNILSKSRGIALDNIPTEPGTTFPSYSLELAAAGRTVLKCTYTYNNTHRGKSSYKLTIDNFFNTTPPSYDIHSGPGANNSVNSLTSTYNPQDQIFLYKTLGDFGQILSFYATSKRAGTGWTSIFSSFDTLSAIISSLFNKSTLLETTKKMSINNLNIYSLVPSVIVAATDKIRQIGLRGLSAAGIMHSLRFPGSGFGKKPNVSVRNTSTKVLKAKLKLVGIPLSKVIRGKRMKLTRKQLEMRAEAFKKLQMRCQKKGISLTYVSKKGRKYKSVKRLLSDMKRKPKPKPKPKPKSKMKWG